eukprot:m.85832 g.85832  ORF g.85832 m.85832 type:complete len:611 (-) comp14854_c0_seq3:835-2667(-)
MVRVLVASVAVCLLMAVLLRGADAVLQRRLLDTPDPADGGRCLDGTPAGYYYEEGTTDVFFILLQGAGACTDLISCQDRLGTNTGSSAAWPATRQGRDGLSSSPEENPDFATAHRVYIPYCTGDTHLGQVTSPDNGLWFDGHLNFVLIVDDLLVETPLSNASQVLLTGPSAGGIGALFNVDTLAAMVPSAVVKAAPRSAWFFPGFTPDQPDDPDAPPTTYDNFAQGKVGGLEPALFDNVWDAFLPAACTNAEPIPERCFRAHVAYRYITSPLYILESRFDAFQLFISLGLPAVEGQEELDYVAYFGLSMAASINQVVAPPSSKPEDGLFLASCLDHANFEIGSPIIVGGYTTAAAIGDWFFERGDAAAIHSLIDDCDGGHNGTLPCNPTCDNKLDVLVDDDQGSGTDDMGSNFTLDGIDAITVCVFPLDTKVCVTEAAEVCIEVPVDECFEVTVQGLTLSSIITSDADNSAVQSFNIGSDGCDSGQVAETTVEPGSCNEVVAFGAPQAVVGHFLLPAGTTGPAETTVTTEPVPSDVVEFPPSPCIDGFSVVRSVRSCSSVQRRSAVETAAVKHAQVTAHKASSAVLPAVVGALVGVTVGVAMTLAFVARR